MKSRVWTFALICLGGLLSSGSAFADGDQPVKRASRHAALKRALDDDGDRHERILHDVASARAIDRMGDQEVARQFRAGHQGQAVLHAKLDRGGDTLGDARVLSVARLARKARARGKADLRRTRDLRGDQPVLTAYKNWRIRNGNLAPDLIIQIGNDDRNSARLRYEAERDPRSGAERLAKDEDSVRRDERQDDREADRQIDGGPGGLGRRSGGVDPDRELEREEDRALDELDKEADRAEEGEDRELDREEDAVEDQEDRDIERQINNEEGDLENELDPEE